MLTPALLLASAATSHAAITLYTDKAAFTAALSGYYEELDMYNQYNLNSGAFSGNGFSYSITVDPAADGILSTQENSQDITPKGGPPSSLTFQFGQFINAFGGNFYANNEDGSFVSQPVTITLATASTSQAFSLTPSTYTQSFFGFISGDRYLTSAIVSVASTNFPAAGDVIVGSVPAPLPLAGAAALFHASRRIRRRIHVLS